MTRADRGEFRADGTGATASPEQEPARTGPIEVECAFCRGTGRDPFGLLSPLARCQVCGGRGCHTLRGPIATCAYCGGSGVHPGSRNTCTTCGGIGKIEIPADAVPCPCCGGSGRAASYCWPDSPLSCSFCGGRGVVSPARVLRQGDGHGD